MTQRQILRRCGFVSSLCIALCSPAASAHGGMDIGGFYQGMATVALHWEQTLLILATGLWCGQQGQTTQPWLGISLVAALAAGVVLSAWQPMFFIPTVFASLAFALAGAAVAAQLRLNPFLLVLVSALIGVASGWALGTSEWHSQAQPWLFTLGLAFGAGMAIFYIAAAVSRLPAGWPGIGVRILGSWIAAIGLIVSATSLPAAG